jgi:endonuclease/exonuclease/phosphatase family metal-dependent hydrolase
MKIIIGIITLFIILWAVPPQLHAQSGETAVLITEIYYNTPGDDALSEWVELANLGSAAIDLSDYSIGDAESPGDYEGMARFPAGAVLEPGQIIIVAQTAVSFQRQFGFNPDYEIQDSDPAVPDMRGYPLWAKGEFGLANDGDELLLLHKLEILDAINYGDSAYFFSPAIGGVLRGQSIERVPAACNTGSAAGWLPRERPTPGEITLDGECATPLDPAVADPQMPIGDIQGSGDYSPYVNQIVTFRGVVTGIQADRNVAGTTYYTLFVQDLPGSSDGNPATSDAIPVFWGWQRPSAQPGDQVRVTGRVTEFFGLTEIDSDGMELVVEASGLPLPDPVLIRPPIDNEEQAAYFEALEGMRVALPEARVVGPSHTACGFAVTRADSPPPPIRRQAADPIGQIVPVLNWSDVDCSGFPDVKAGDGVTGLTGPLTYHFDQFKIVQQEPEALAVTAVPPSPLPPPPTLQPGQIAIASFNVENHFDAIDDTGSDAEPKPSPADIALRQQKLAYAISETLGCPTLIGVQEVEKGALLTALAEEAAPACGFTYAVTHLESADARGIDVALLTNPEQAQVISARLRQGCTRIETGIEDETAVCPPGQSPLFSRPPLQVELDVGGVHLTIYVNHLKSKRGGEAETAPRRAAQAQHLADLVDEQLAADPQARIIVLGDFNDYDESPAMQLLAENGRLTNTLQRIPEPERYTYNYGGVRQMIDAIFVSPALNEAIAGVTIRHSNADYPDSLSRDVSPANLPYKATDHDLPLLILDWPLPEPTPPPPTAVPQTAPTPLPKAPSTTNRAAGWLWLAGIVGGTAVIGGIVVALRRQSGVK